MVKGLKPETAEKVKRSLQRYCDTTSVHGCNELFHAKTLFWRVVWFILVAGACAVTSYQVYSSILQYIGRGTVTQVLPPEPGGVQYPPMAMCYIHWISWVNWEKAYEMGFRKESILYAMSFLTNIFSSTIFDIERAKADFVKTLTKNNLTTLTQFYTAIAMSFPMTEGGVFSVVSKDPPFFKTFRITFKDPKYYMCYIVSGQEIANELKKKQESSSVTSRASKGLFTYSVQDPNYNLYKDYVTYEEYNYYTAHWVCDQSSYWAIHLEDYARNYTLFTLPIKMYPDANSNEVIVLMTDNEAYNVLMKPSVKRSKNTEKEPCAVGKKAISTSNECEKSCEAKRNNRLLDCMYVDEAAIYNQDTVGKLCSYPINFLQYQRENPDFKTYPCDNFVPTGPDDKLRTNKTTIPRSLHNDKDTIRMTNIEYNDCMNNCSTACEIWKYSASVSILAGSPAVIANTFKNQTNFNYYYPLETDVLIVIDIDAQTWEDFVANVGGLLGVWTGASFISFMQIPYLLCCADVDTMSVKSLFSCKKKNNNLTSPFNANTEGEGEGRRNSKQLNVSKKQVTSSAEIK